MHGERVTAPATTAPPRAALLTVDDDPGVSRAVARDLRRHYGETHRIVRAESGEQALDALREMKLRGEQVAVLLADFRMPRMSGIEFLEQAMDLYPAAKRVLLTAYADTEAAIDAINVIDLDYYLLKPWDPPEEKLYPVVDSLLEVWNSADHRPVPETKVVGHRWSARSAEVREFLARNQVPYRWFGVDQPEGQALLAAAGADDHTLPVVITTDGDPLVAPSDGELAGRVGLTTTPSKDFYDLIVIGGGPAGLGAAVYGASEGLRTVLLERTATGGQAGQSSRIENYLGFPDGVSGGQRLGPDCAPRRRSDHRRAHRHPGHGRVLPAAGGAGCRRADRPRRLLRLGPDRSCELRESGRVHRRWSELGRPGRGLSRPGRSIGDLVGQGTVARVVDVLLPHPADRSCTEHLGTELHRGSRRSG